jgi:hypothetical protein
MNQPLSRSAYQGAPGDANKRASAGFAVGTGLRSRMSRWTGRRAGDDGLQIADAPWPRLPRHRFGDRAGWAGSCVVPPNRWDDSLAGPRHHQLSHRQPLHGAIACVIKRSEVVRRIGRFDDTIHQHLYCRSFDSLMITRMTLSVAEREHRRAQADGRQVASSTEYRPRPRWAQTIERVADLFLPGSKKPPNRSLRGADSYA